MESDQHAPEGKLGQIADHDADGKPVWIDAEKPELRAQEIRMRRLEIAATLAEWKRAFFVDGVEHPFSARVTLEAEDAALALEARVISTDAEMAKVARRKKQNASLLAQLLEVLKERGMGELVAEAERRSAEASASAAEPVDGL